MQADSSWLIKASVDKDERKTSRLNCGHTPKSTKGWRKGEKENSQLTKKKQLDILGRLYPILFQIFFNLLTSSQSSPFLGAHCTSMAEKKGAPHDLQSIRSCGRRTNTEQTVRTEGGDRPPTTNPQTIEGNGSNKKKFRYETPLPFNS
ncbi:hypothetical protein TNCT_518281 [Trichonephila clavata]|uniref:Uncharacterized protein n=1 Tax=Trichonephila clavata TaxID=2740835 RepID=A0A8X6HXS7_TRICU|nr:hypothetical protein TNCT_518281 [Trichonephila clavata]